MLKIGKIVMGSVQTNCYFLYEEDKNKIIVVDPADRGEYLYNAFKEVFPFLEIGVDNDGHAAALAEMYYGNLKDIKNVQLLPAVKFKDFRYFF